MPAQLLRGRFIVLNMVAILASFPVAAAGQSSLDVDAIGDAAGTEATTTADGVVRVAW